eukprot:CAMPEP_0201479066 /NCGR_PEP_ID=MMETSP0151_2-20130828/3808_1 /ASSEMBLY_ACC=CAM_ASM_000257 /TAXON_ID=200890 /ORGANISM="Paramoeba atlantica, Strain 621/1 / CCAP 1560/9" /LENGTH=356 /DNA_ID=CAMNT_0047860395 /DNA_START=198 /DNA_END=1268 /DNA_ORIENTATION=-
MVPDPDGSGFNSLVSSEQISCSKESCVPMTNYTYETGDSFCGHTSLLNSIAVSNGIVFGFWNELYWTLNGCDGQSGQNSSIVQYSGEYPRVIVSNATFLGSFNLQLRTKWLSFNLVDNRIYWVVEGSYGSGENQGINMYSVETDGSDLRQDANIFNSDGSVGGGYSNGSPILALSSGIVRVVLEGQSYSRLYRTPSDAYQPDEPTRFLNPSQGVLLILNEDQQRFMNIRKETAASAFIYTDVFSGQYLSTGSYFTVSRFIYLTYDENWNQMDNIILSDWTDGNDNFFPASIGVDRVNNRLVMSNFYFAIHSTGFQASLNGAHQFGAIDLGGNYPSDLVYWNNWWGFPSNYFATEND